MNVNSEIFVESGLFVWINWDLMYVSVPKVQFQNLMPKLNAFRYRDVLLTMIVRAIPSVIQLRSVFVLILTSEMIADVNQRYNSFIVIMNRICLRASKFNVMNKPTFLKAEQYH